MSERSFDYETALRRVGGDGELLETILEVFRSECPALLRRIEQAIAVGDREGLALAAHTLKGSADAVACEPLVRSALEVERLGRVGDFGAAKQALPELQRVARLALAALGR